MPEEDLQAAFEIKTACDEISRRLLRWHLDHKPGAHSFGALLDHVAQRQQESPDYYDRMPDLSGKNSWQQLDTTICMRVLLDPEKDAAKPLDLLGNTSNWLQRLPLLFRRGSLICLFKSIYAGFSVSAPTGCF